MDGERMEFALQKTLSAAEVKRIPEEIEIKTERTGRINECICENSWHIGRGTEGVQKALRQ